MKLAKVLGSVVSVRKVSNLKSLKLMVVEYLDDELKPSKKTAVCTDTVSAGEGDVVIVCSSSSARQTEITNKACTDNSIVGIVDSIHSRNEWIYNSSEVN